MSRPPTPRLGPEALSDTSKREGPPVGGIVVAGIGNWFRGDDAVGPILAERLAEAGWGALVAGPFGEPLDLLGVWDKVDLALVLDASLSGRPPGTVQATVLDAQSAVLLRFGAATSSTHGIGLGGVLKMSLALGTAPRWVVAVTVEGECFELGAELSPAVEDALPAALRLAQALLEGWWLRS